MFGKNTRVALEEGLQWATSPWDRLPILIELAKEIKPHQPDYPFQHAHEALRVAKELNDRFWIARSLQAIGVLQSRLMRFSEALENLQEAASLFAEIEDSRMEMQVRLSIADIHVITGRLDEGLKQIVECRHFFEDLGDPEWMAWSFRSLGNFHKAMSDHAKTIRYFRRSVAIAKGAGLEWQLAGLYQHLSEGYFRMERFGLAWKYLRKSLEFAQKHGDVRGVAAVVGSAAAGLTSVDLNMRAEKYVRLSLKFSRALAHTAHEGVSWAMLGEIYSLKSDFDKALRCFKRGLRLAKECEDPRLLGILLEQVGSLYIRMEDYPCGLRYLRQGITLTEQSGQVFGLFISHLKLAEACESAGDAAGALHHFKEHARLKAEHFNNIKLLEASREETRRRMRGLAKRLRTERAHNEELRQTIEEKRSELAAMMRQLIGEEEIRGRAEQLEVNIHRKGNTLSEQSWDAFARQFHKVHHGFYPDLVRRYPQLTPAEIKVCSLIRIGLSSREIATTLNLSKRTVDNHRARILGKMNLPEGSSLSEYIAGM